MAPIDRAQEFMDRGDLVPDEVVVTMVKDALDTPAAKEKGWLLDGYPRSASQVRPRKREPIDVRHVQTDPSRESAARVAAPLARLPTADPFVPSLYVERVRGQRNGQTTTDAHLARASRSFNDDDPGSRASLPRG